MEPRFRTIEVSDPALEVEGLRQITVHSRALRGRGDITAWVPDADGPLPIAILLHGVYGSHWAWAAKAGVHRTAARLVATGAIPPMVLAMPSDGLWEDGSWYIAQPGRDAETWIADDVPAAIEAAVPAASAAAGLCIGGLSMGGFGALRLGGLRPGQLRAVAGHSSVTTAAELTELGFTSVRLEDHGVDPARLTVVDALVSSPGPLPRIRFDCGVDDPLIESNRRLHRELDAAGVAHTYEEHPGGHEWPYWTEHVEATLRFFGTSV
jgi:putative tributyrin esterase